MDATADRILDATVAEAAATGLERITMDRVARRAGVTRATVYRHFQDRDKLVSAMAARDTNDAIEVFSSALTGSVDPVDGLSDAFVAVLRWTRNHEFITRAAKLEPGYIIAAGLADDAAMLRQAVAYGTNAISDWYTGPADPEQLAETIARLLASYVLLPVTVSVPLEDDDAIRVYVRSVIGPLLNERPATDH